MMVPVVKQNVEKGQADACDRPLRADARRNRERVLEAAEVLFAEEGLKVQIEQVAQRAGVGVGTVCRNFPTKQDLVEAVLTGMCQALLDGARAALLEPDAGAAFGSFCAAMAEFQVRHRAFAEEMANGLDMPSSARSVKQELHEVVDQLVARAQACGALRDDIGSGDILMLFSGIAHAASVAGEGAPVLRQRYLGILLDGLRPLQPSPLAGSPMSFEQLKAAKESAAR